MDNGITYAGKVIKLAADIRFDGITPGNFKSIGDYYYYGNGTSTRGWRAFEGTFDGNGYTISGIYCIDGALFDYVGSNGIVKNLTVENCKLSYGIVYNNEGIIDNCHNRNTEISGAGGGGEIGGIAAINADTGKITNCSSTGTITGSGIYFAGGIVGENTGEICNSCNIGDINVVGVTGAFSDYARAQIAGIGGITGGGWAAQNGKVLNCYNAGKITVPTDVPYAGLISSALSTVVANNFWDEATAEIGIQYSGVTSNNKRKTASEMQTVAFVNELNANRGDNAADWLEWEIRSGESTYPVQVKRVRITDCQITLDNTPIVYDGTEKTPGISIVYRGKTLVNGIDYKLACQNNINAGTATVAIEGIGLYMDDTTREFTIACADISQAAAAVDSTNLVYDGSAKTPGVTVIYAERNLTDGEDYTAEYQNNINAGMAQVILSGKGNFTGSLTQNFTINKATQTFYYSSSYQKAYGNKAFSLNAKSIAPNAKLTYSSANKKVAAVSSNGKVSIKGTGIAVLTVKAAATENYNANSVKVTVRVAPKKPTIKSVNVSSGRKMTVKWQKDKRANGYQVQYSTNRNFYYGVKTVTVSKNKTTSKTISKLVKGQKYYVRVRAYKSAKLNGRTEKIYSSWSKVKKSKSIKK